MPKLSEAQARVLRYLVASPGQRCSDVGDVMPRIGPVRKRQCYCRPAGAVLYRLMDRELVSYRHEGDAGRLWYPTSRGRAALAAAGKGPQ